MVSADAPILLEGPGHRDAEALGKMIRDVLEAELDDLYLTRNFSGDLVFEFRARFVGGTLKSANHSMQRRRRRLFGED